MSGYSATFIDSLPVAMPELKPGHPLSATAEILPYRHFSVLFSKARKLPVCTAVNIDGETFQAINRDTDKWIFDARMPEASQLGNEFYKETGQAFHRGHVVRRLDPCWGKVREAAKAMLDTFHFTNSCPQHAKFNPRIWLELERNVLEKGSVAFAEKISVFAGPILRPEDKPFIKKICGEYILVPESFWKVIIWKKENGNKYAVGFIQSQSKLIQRFLYQGPRKARETKSEDYFEHLQFKDGNVYQVGIGEIEHLTGLDLKLQQLNQPVAPAAPEPLTINTNAAVKNRSGFRAGELPYLNISGLVLD